MKRILFAVLLFLSVSFLFAQTPDTTWKKGGLFSLGFAQSSFSNWAAGGENAISGNAIINLFMNYKKGDITWDNNIDLAYGMIITPTQTRKNDDKIDLNSKWGRLAVSHWYYSALINFKSQFAPGYNYPDDSTVISRFAAPAYTLLSIGMDYKPSDVFSFYVSPATGKITTVSDQKLADAGAFGVEKAATNDAGMVITPGERIRFEFGAYVTMKYQQEIMKNITLKTKLDLFSNYSHNPQNIDVNWDSFIGLKVNKYITASISATLIYDDDILYKKDVNKDGAIDTETGDIDGPRTQFREIFALGLSYKF
jgi:hypothetical protein